MTQVSTGATLACSFGSAPAVLTVNPTRTVVATTLAAKNTSAPDTVYLTLTLPF